jgi:peptide/nickel transport system substrate-binding protein
VKFRTSALVVAAAATALALGLSACSSGSSTSSSGSDASIRIGSVYEPQNLDNTAGGGQGVTEALNGNVYEGLFKLTDDGKVTKLLDKSYTVSPDGLKYTFTLRSGVKFHSGATLTSADVKYSIDKVTASNSQSARKSNFAVVKNIATPDADTVVITLKSKSISFVYNLSYIWIINHKATNLKTTEDGTGPYKLDTWKHGSSLSLTRFADYWGTAAKNKEVVFDYYKDATAENNALHTGAVAVVTSEQSPDALTQFTSNSSFKVNNGHSTTKLLLAFNDKKAPFNNVLVRTAITQGINDKKLLSSIWGKYGTVTGSMVPPTDPWYEDLTNVHPYDPTKAKQELAKAGFANGLTFTLDTPNYDPHPAAAQFIKSELAKIGVTVNINIITADEWYTKVYQNHDFVATMQEHVNDRDVVFYGNPDFYWGYDNPKVTNLINEAEQSDTTAQQTADLKKANEQIVADSASDWLYLYPQIVVASTKISGYPLNGLNSQFYAYDIVKKG